jgi:hypothetical protein
MGTYKEPYKKDPDEVGAIWVKQGAQGEYLSLSMNGQYFVAFKNKFKKEAKHPDWVIKKSKPKPEPRPDDGDPAPF